MGNSAARIKWPGFRYIKNFNIENRAIKKLEVQETDVQARKLAPRHPSTVKILQELEGFKLLAYYVLNYLINK
jgi:hypothetical protein